MTRPSRKARWRSGLFRTRAVPATIRLVMLALAEYMGEDGRVSVPVATMSARLGISQRRVLAAYQAAIEAGLLDRVSPGYVGHTAEYQALLPGPERVSEPSTLSDRQRVTKTDTLSPSETDTLSPPERVSVSSTPIESATHLGNATAGYAVARHEERSDEGAGADGCCSSCGWHVRNQGHASECEVPA